MKRMVIIGLAIICIGLAACNGKSELAATTEMVYKETIPITETAKTAGEKYSMDDMVGKWHCPEEAMVLIIGKNNVELHCVAKSADYYPYPPVISGGKLLMNNIIQFGIFDIENDGTKMKIRSEETLAVSEGTTFEKCEEVISMDELQNHVWVNENGNRLSFPDGCFEFKWALATTKMRMEDYYLAGDTLYLSDLEIFKIVKEDDSIVLIGKETGKYYSE